MKTKTILYITLIMVIVIGCSETSITEQIGKDFRAIRNDFEKGYNQPDTSAWEEGTILTVGGDGELIPIDTNSYFTIISCSDTTIIIPWNADMVYTRMLMSVIKSLKQQGFGYEYTDFDTLTIDSI